MPHASQAIVQFIESDASAKSNKALVNANLHPVAVYLSSAENWRQALANMITFRNASDRAAACVARYAAACHELDQNDADGIYVRPALKNSDLEKLLHPGINEIDAAIPLGLHDSRPEDAGLVIIPAHYYNHEQPAGKLLRITNDGGLTVMFEPIGDGFEPISCSWAEFLVMAQAAAHPNGTFAQTVWVFLTAITAKELRALRDAAHQKLYPTAVPVGSW